MLTRTLLIAALLASAGMANAYDVSKTADGSRSEGMYVVGSGYTGFTSGLLASSEDSQRMGPYDMVSANEIQERQGYGLDTLEQRV